VSSNLRVHRAWALTDLRVIASSAPLLYDYVLGYITRCIYDGANTRVDTRVSAFRRVRRRGTGAQPNDLVKLLHSISLRVPGVKRLWIEIDVGPGPVTASALQRSPIEHTRTRACTPRGGGAATASGSYECFMEHLLPAGVVLSVFACD